MSIELLDSRVVWVRLPLAAKKAALSEVLHLIFQPRSPQTYFSYTVSCTLHLPASSTRRVA
jgi:hypothetical protein